MIRLVLVLVALAACTPAQRVAALATASTTLLIADWHQTTKIVEECRELNPIIGECGERVSPDLYFLTTIAAHLAVGVLLPEHWRDVWFGTIAGAEASIVWSNTVTTELHAPKK